MVDSDPPTPMRTRSAAASSFETAASTPSSRVETPSPKPKRDNKNKSSTNKSNSSTENKNGKNKYKKKESEAEHTYEIGDITMKDLTEAGTSGVPGNKERPLVAEETAMIGMTSDCEIVESGTVVSETSASAARLKRGKRRRMEATRDSEDSITDAEVRQTIREDTLDALTSLSASTIASRAYE